MGDGSLTWGTDCARWQHADQTGAWGNVDPAAWISIASLSTTPQTIDFGGYVMGK
jgi:hypothetical protein